MHSNSENWIPIPNVITYNFFNILEINKFTIKLYKFTFINLIKQISESLVLVPNCYNLSTFIFPKKYGSFS